MTDQEKLIADLTAERDDARRSLDSVNERLSILSDRHDLTQSELASLESQRRALRLEIESVKTENWRLKSELTTLQTSYDALKAEHETAEVRAARMVCAAGIVHGEPRAVSRPGSPGKSLTERVLEAKASVTVS